MLDASESRWSLRTGADGMRNGLRSNRTERLLKKGPVGFGGTSHRYKRHGIVVEYR